MSDLARIADALERIANHLAPIRQPWKRADCTGCDYCSQGPADYVDPWVAKHQAESGHEVRVEAMEEGGE